MSGSSQQIAILGTGALASALTLRLVQAGQPPSVWGRDSEELESLCRASGAQPLRSLEQAAQSSVVMLCVSDRAIEPVARSLSELEPSLPSQVVLHTSGYHAREPLALLAEAGWCIGGWHPLVSLPARSPETGAACLPGSLCAIFGDAPAQRAAQDLTRLLGAHPFALPEGARPAYHAAAALAGNGLVALLDLALETVSEEIPREDLRRGLVHLCRSVLDTLEQHDTAHALTGPVARGDSAVVDGHLAAMPAVPAGVYRMLLQRMLALSTEAGLDAESQERLGSLLHRD